VKLLEFLKMVRVEATHLRDNATKEEKANLNFDSIDPYSSSDCIYGQMTGNCESDRAHKLCPKTIAVLFLITPSVKRAAETSRTLEKEDDDDDGWFCYTPIEVYVGAAGSNASGLLKYIKGTNKTLKL
jgi:hypothetical protein